MPFAYISRSLRQILPRREIRLRDQRPGAYPVKSKTGDGTRSGRNRVYFDDTRTVFFLTGVNVSYPTTFQLDPKRVASDLASSLGTEPIGNVDPYAVDQFLLSHAQTERPGPFVEANTYEQDETNVINSAFMTGVAYGVASDRFKSKVSDKTILRLELPLRSTSQLSPSSSIAYFNPTRGAFETKIVEPSYNSNGQTWPMLTFAPIPFTPYGMHFMPLNDNVLNGFFGGGTNNPIDAAASVQRLTTYAADGSDPPFFNISGFTTGFATASVLNPSHTAAPSQTVQMSDHIGHPFLLEKIVVEFPFAAGPGWLNDRFGFREILQSDLSLVADAGGPMVTFALMRQDKADGRFRDVIASGTITNALDMTTGSYQMCSTSFAGPGGLADVIFTPEAVASLLVSPNVVVAGNNEPSGTNNFFTGTVKLVMEPSVTSHVLRTRLSGSSVWFMPGGIDFAFGSVPVSASKGCGNASQALGTVFGPIAKRSSKYVETGRSILGNDFALLTPADLLGSTHPVKVIDAQFENLSSKFASPNRIFKKKLYVDVKSNTIKSPYLLYPEDQLVLCISKHRAVGSTDAGDWDFFDLPPSPNRLSAYHDVSIPTGSLKITLYGDLVRDDQEYHDTLNQRLETEELWQDIGEDPVLDQFDVVYRQELSGTYLDRFRVRNTVPSALLEQALSSSFETDSYYSNFGSQINNNGWSTQYSWSAVRSIEELKKSCKNVNLFSTNERYWDTRVPEPFATMNFVNSNFRLEGYDSIPQGIISNILYTGTTYNAGTADRGIRDWFMTYPYEAKYNSVSTVFVESVAGTKRTYRSRAPGGGGPTTATPVNLTLGQINLVVGDDSVKRYLYGDTLSGSIGATSIGATFYEFVRIFYGIGDGHSRTDNQFALPTYLDLNSTSHGSIIRGWRYGMMSAFALNSKCMYRRDRYGQPRDMLEQRKDAKFFDTVGLSSDGNSNGAIGVKDGPVQVKFYDRQGKLTDALKTLSSNVSFEATSSVPYTDGKFSNRPDYDFSQLNITRVVI